jgi:diguanylate cyclase (GGDEF)-like protein
MLDIDHFKGINDNYGHAAGDDTLKSLTNLVSGILRQVDLFGRLGGEEFVILMPETSPQAAGEAAERIRQTVADTPVDTSEGRIVFTVSIGVSEFQKQDKDVHDLLARADQALYAAKESGRNRVLQWLPQNGPDIGQIGPP